MRWLTRLDLALGEFVCRRLWEHDHDYIDDPPTLTGLFALSRWRPPGPLNEVAECPTCGLPLRVDPDGTDLYVTCADEHEVSSVRERRLWERALATNGWARVCVNWWEQIGA